MDRVRKGTDEDTSKSLISWQFQVRTWANCIDLVQDQIDRVRPAKKQKKLPTCIQVQVHDKYQLVPTDDLDSATFFPLQRGGNNLLCNSARISYYELGTLIAAYTGWGEDLVRTTAEVRLYCHARVLHPDGQTRTYWATESRYPFNEEGRRNMVELDLGQGNVGVAQITAFLQISTPAHGENKGILVRWMDKSTLSTNTDDEDRPLCDFPLSFNHCLWQWSDAGTNRDSFNARGFRVTVARQNLWNHIPQHEIEDSIRSERRARYDIVKYENVRHHVNIHRDPSTGHMLQTLQIV